MRILSCGFLPRIMKNRKSVSSFIFCHFQILLILWQQLKSSLLRRKRPKSEKKIKCKIFYILKLIVPTNAVQSDDILIWIDEMLSKLYIKTIFLILFRNKKNSDQGKKRNFFFVIWIRGNWFNLIGVKYNSSPFWHNYGFGINTSLQIFFFSFFCGVDFNLV